MNVGFEAKRLFSNFTGLGNYSRFIVEALSTNFPDNTYYLYTPRAKKHPEVDPLTARPNIKIVTPKGIFAKPGFSAVWRSWAMTRQSSVKGLSIFHGLSQELPMGLPSTIKKVVTVHDLIFLRYPQFYNSIDVRIYTRKVTRACKEADSIVAISEQTAADILAFLNPEWKEKIRVVYQGTHPSFDRQPSALEFEAIRKKYNLPGQFLLNVGTIEERKNLLTLIRALALVPENIRLPLIVIGRPTEYFKLVTSEIENLKLTRWVTFLLNVPFHDFPPVYQLATAFIYPSLFEGFGIPLVEAIKSRVPVITSTGSCFREAAGPGALYADPKSADDIAKCLGEVLSDEYRRAEMVKTSLTFVERFSAHSVSTDLEAVYRSLL